MKSEILIIAPHPDDEILGCGGSMIKYIDRKHRVGVLYLSSGDKQEDVREREANEVCDFLGVRDRFFLRLNGQSFNSGPENIEQLHTVFAEFSPNVVFCCHDQDSDKEHKVAAQLVMESYWRFNALPNIRRRISGLISYEVHKPLASYNLVEDITGQFDRKMKALSLYKSQLSKSNLDLAIGGLNQYRGEMHENSRYAEVFQIRRLHSLVGFV